MLFYIRHIAIILRQAIEGMRISNNGSIPKFDGFLFFALPVLFALYLVRAGFLGSSDVFDRIDGDLLISISIFIGFLINMLMPFFSFIERLELDLMEKRETLSANLFKLEEARVLQYRILFSQLAVSILCSLASIFFILIAKYPLADIAHFEIAVYSWSIPIGSLTYLAVRFLAYVCVGLNFLNLLRILISANVLIYPKLKL